MPSSTSSGAGRRGERRTDPLAARSPAAASPETGLAGLAARPPSERQLTIYDALQAQVDELERSPAIAALAAGERPSPGTLELLGESEGFARMIVELLRRNGWKVAPLPQPFAGEGVALVATCSWAEVHGFGATFSAAVRDLISEVATYFGVRQEGPPA